MFFYLLSVLLDYSAKVFLYLTIVQDIFTFLFDWIYLLYIYLISH